MTATIDPSAAQPVRRRLLAWYDRHRRDLPWRQTRDPYRIWLSEMMLQQTQVATVLPYFARFTQRFPTVRDLAAADLDDVLRLWSGLGYYARARNLHRAAQVVTDAFNGRFPEAPHDLEQLPGVGRYTAGAIASIAFNRRAPVVDGNVTRVLTRLFDLDCDVGGAAGQAQVWDVAEQVLPRRRCGDFNQALMELGATVCLPGAAAQCLTCPLQSTCKAVAAGTVAARPVKSRKTAVRDESHAVAAIRDDDKWLFVRRPTDGLWGGLWELPTARLNGESSQRAVRSLSRRHAAQPCHIRRRPFCDVRHQLTHRAIRFIGHVCAPSPSAQHTARSKPVPADPGGAGDCRWLRLDDLDRVGISTAMRKVIDALKQHCGDMR